MKFKDITLRNAIRIVKAKYYKFIKKEYNKYWNDDAVEEMLYKTAQCPDCYMNGSCLECGCDFKELITTDKPCPKGKF